MGSSFVETLVHLYNCGVDIFGSTNTCKTVFKKSDSNVARLKPPILFVLMIPAAGLLFLFLLGVALRQGAGDDLWVMIALLSFFPLTMAFFTYFCYMRQIYWDAVGISCQTPFCKKMIQWDEITYAGKGIDGGFVVKSANASIRFTALEGGCEHLNKEIQKRCQSSKVNF